MMSSQVDPVDQAKERLLHTVQKHTPQKANRAGRRAERFKIRHTDVKGKMTQRTAKQYPEAVTTALGLLALDEVGEVEIEDRTLDCTWRLV